MKCARTKIDFLKDCVNIFVKIFVYILHPVVIMQFH